MLDTYGAQVGTQRPPIGLAQPSAHDSTDGDTMLRKERHRFVLQSFERRSDPSDRGEICKRVGGKTVNDGMRIDSTRSLKPAEEKRADA